MYSKIKDGVLVKFDEKDIGIIDEVLSKVNIIGGAGFFDVFSRDWKEEIGAFSGCLGLTNIIIPDNIAIIGVDAFAGCSNLTNITIPNSIIQIERYAFSGCSNLKEIIIPNSIKSISEATFHGCSSLTKVSIPNSVTRIGWDAFSGCSSLTEIKIPDSVELFGYSALKDCLNLQKVTMPLGAELGSGTFDGCENLNYVNEINVKGLTSEEILELLENERNINNSLKSQKIEEESFSQ